MMARDGRNEHDGRRLSTKSILNMKTSRRYSNSYRGTPDIGLVDDDHHDGDKVIRFIYSEAVVQALKKMGIFINLVNTPDPRVRGKGGPVRQKSEIEICKLPQIYSDVRRVVGSRGFYTVQCEKPHRDYRAASLPNETQAGYYASVNMKGEPGKGKNYTVITYGQTNKRHMSLPNQLSRRRKSLIPDAKRLKLPQITRK